jgi:hypothetical protein
MGDQTHDFRSTDIRRSMDVFGLDGDRIGTVLRVRPGPTSGNNIPDNLPFTPDIRIFDGESIGPAPTRAIGNFGPATQAPEHRYGASARSGEPLGTGEMHVGTLLTLFRRRWISLDEVQTVSMERVILRKPASYYLGESPAS